MNVSSSRQAVAPSTKFGRHLRASKQASFDCYGIPRVLLLAKLNGTMRNLASRDGNSSYNYIEGQMLEVCKLPSSPNQSHTSLPSSTTRHFLLVVHESAYARPVPD